ncbi:MAG: phosphatase PAP2 family protein [Bacteroidota bacterium]|nr:phosphatase PAP2 family protein [Bacteroidota bacterium]
MDIQILNWLNHHRILWLDPFIQFITDTAYVFAISVPIIILIIGYIKKNKLIQFRAWFILISIFWAEIISTILKFSINRTRPFKVYPFIEKLTAGGSPSFPSGHTTDAFVLCCSIILVYKKWQFSIPVFVWAILVGYSRMALGVHYPTDVLGGIAIGLSAPLMIKYFIPQYKNKI